MNNNNNNQTINEADEIDPKRWYKLSPFSFDSGLNKLHVAVLEGEYDKVSKILKHEPHLINSTASTRLTPLMIACRGQYNSSPNINIIQLLLEQPDININKTRLAGETTLKIACEGTCCNDNVIELLLKHQTELNLEFFGFSELQNLTYSIIRINKKLISQNESIRSFKSLLKDGLSDTDCLIAQYL